MWNWYVCEEDGYLAACNTSEVGELIENDAQLTHLDNFFYDFSIPHISKEFDLLKIYEDDCIVNIELKSREVEEEKIKKQLEKNKFIIFNNLD